MLTTHFIDSEGPSLALYAVASFMQGDNSGRFRPPVNSDL